MKTSVIDLTQVKWALSGWRRNAWSIGFSLETNWRLSPDIGPVPAKLPGSVQRNLLLAGLLEDWNLGLNSRKAEWIEHYHWEFSAEIECAEEFLNVPISLQAETLDHSGWILVNGRTIATFSGAMRVHCIPLENGAFRSGKNRISLIFDCPPTVDGQIGWTSRTSVFKPRYNYSWDWCPRFVPIGVSGHLQIVFGEKISTSSLVLSAEWDHAERLGSLRYQATFPSLSGEGDFEATLEVSGAEGCFGAVSKILESGSIDFSIRNLKVAPWWPNGSGSQSLYTVRVRVGKKGEAPVWEDSRRVGFRSISWKACKDAPEGALPWICTINGREVFLQGVNWTPARLDYLSVEMEELYRLLEAYQEMGCNVLRVWGGGVLEKSAFYDKCDELGLLIWQDFPLSSSGLDNWPPEAESVLEELGTISRTLVRRLRHHACILMWCGGNELQGGLDGSKMGAGKPVGEDQPCIKMLSEIVKSEDPSRRFIPTSPTGPRFTAAREDFGKGLHHEVHGPWGEDGFNSRKEWEDYWSADDSLFRSEVSGVGPASVEMIMKYGGGEATWPPTSRLWTHSSVWWLRPHLLAPYLNESDPAKALEKYVDETQANHASTIEFAARSCRERFPRCGGILIWMGHDSFPCPLNTSIIDFDGNRKPAYHALKQIFLGSFGKSSGISE